MRKCSTIHAEGVNYPLAVGGHWHPSRAVALGIAALGGLFALLHELVCCFVWSSLRERWIDRKVGAFSEKR